MTSNGIPHWQTCSGDLRARRACRHTWEAVVRSAVHRANKTGRRFRVELGPHGWRAVDLGRIADVS